MIQIRNLNFQYLSGKSVLKNIDLEIKEGETLSIIGKNGAGKSSLVRLLAGLVKPTSGTILIDEINVQERKKAKEIRKKIGIVFQNPENQILFPKVQDDLEFALKNLDLPNRETRIREALQKVGMENYSNEDTYELSLGQKQRINIASALAVNPKYLILDEPTTMIDSNGKDKIYEIVRNLKKEGHTIIYVTNNMSEILLADRILILENGNIKTIFSKEEIFEKMDFLKQSQIKVPEIVQIIAKLKQNGKEIFLQEWTEQEMMQEILKVCGNEK